MNFETDCQGTHRLRLRFSRRRRSAILGGSGSLVKSVYITRSWFPIARAVRRRPSRRVLYSGFGSGELGSRMAQCRRFLRAKWRPPEDCSREMSSSRLKARLPLEQRCDLTVCLPWTRNDHSYMPMSEGMSGAMGWSFGIGKFWTAKAGP